MFLLTHSGRICPYLSPLCLTLGVKKACHDLSPLPKPKPAPLVIAMHSATGKMRTSDLPNNHMQVFYFMSAGSLLLHTLLKTPVILLGFTEIQNTPDAD